MVTSPNQECWSRQRLACIYWQTKERDQRNEFAKHCNKSQQHTPGGHSKRHLSFIHADGRGDITRLCRVVESRLQGRFPVRKSTKNQHINRWQNPKITQYILETSQREVEPTLRAAHPTDEEGSTCPHMAWPQFSQYQRIWTNLSYYCMTSFHCVMGIW